jgi:hypothetical protein
MANIVLGAMVVEARGSVGGSTFSRNAGGAYARGRVKPTNPQTPFQSLVRSMLGANAKNWGSVLTDAQRSAWITVAPEHPLPNKVGAIITLSGIQMYQQLNMVLALVGSTPIDVPPADFSISALNSVAVTATSGGTPALFLTVDPIALATDEMLYVSATPQGSASRNFAKNVLRFVGTVADGASPINILTLWNTRFGSPALVAGQRITVGVSVVNTVTGVLSPITTATTIVS